MYWLETRAREDDRLEDRELLRGQKLWLSKDYTIAKEIKMVAAKLLGLKTVPSFKCKTSWEPKLFWMASEEKMVKYVQKKKRINFIVSSFYKLSYAPLVHA